jgi:hypothetical protein
VRVTVIAGAVVILVLVLVSVGGLVHQEASVIRSG